MKRNRRNSRRRIDWLSVAVWAYFLLIIFEGALRKWFLPFAATPLLVVRDPIAIWIVFESVRRHIVKASPWLLVFWSVGFIAWVIAMTAGHGNVVVATYGARIYWIHLPLIFCIGKIWSREQVVRLGRAVLWMAIPMFVLVVLQFYSPQSAWVNRGVGGDLDGAGFGGAMGFMRPPGTFSFTNGVTNFFGLAIAFFFGFLLDRKRIATLLLATSGVAIFLAIPFTIGRVLVFQSAVTFLFFLVVIARKPKYLIRIAALIVLFGVIGTALNFVPLFAKSLEVMLARFEEASISEGGIEGTLSERFLGGLMNAVTDFEGASLTGEGVGLGTNIGAKFTFGTRGFVLAEEEWPRTVGELGILTGLFVIATRVLLGVKLSLLSYRKMVKKDPLPWMLLSYGLLLVVQGNTAQPTSLGFVVMSGALITASLRTKISNTPSLRDSSILHSVEPSR